MKQKLIPLCVALLALVLCNTPLFAEDFAVDGIYYKIISSTNKTVAVTYCGSSYDTYSNEYSGAVTIPESVTYNGNTYSVTSIGYEAFRNCSSLTSVEIPNSVTSIGYDAFRNCSSLTSVEIPNSVTSIGFSAFSHCSSLTSVKIPNSVTSIGSSAFSYCDGLISVEIPNSVTSIEAYAFSYCSSLTSVVIGNSVTSIGFSAFSHCSSLTSVVIGNSVTSIGVLAFSCCDGLTSVEIPNSVTSIGSSAFYGCSSLTSVEIPNSVTSIGESAFGGCPSLTSIVVAEDNAIYDSRDNCNAIIETQTNTLIAGCSETTIPNSVTSIGISAFYNCSSLTSVVIPNSVTSIGDAAFQSCRGLTSMEIPNSVTSIGENAFSDCSSLTSVVIPNSVTSIGNSAFRYCYSLTSVEIPNSVTSIGNETFLGCSRLTSVEIPNSVTSIGDEAFKRCSRLTSVEIPNSVTSIGENAFSDCSSLTSVVIPNSVTSIGISAFQSCSSLTSVEIPNSVTSIGISAFQSCSSLTSVVIPNSVTSIGKDAFSGTAWYNNQPDGVVYLDTYLLHYKGTMPSNTSIEIKDGTLLIADDAFSGFDRLTSVVIPNSVTSIGSKAFRGCYGLKIVTVGCSWKTKSLYNFGANVTVNATLHNFENGICTVCHEKSLRFEVNGIYYNITSEADKTVEVTYSGSNSYSGAVTIPESVTYNGNTYSVTRIGESAFSGCSSLTSVVIPNSVTSIGEYAFDGCSSLTNIIIPNSVTDIEYGAFFRCTNLTEITVGCSWKTYSRYNLPSRVKVKHTPHSFVNGICEICGETASQSDQFVTIDMLTQIPDGEAFLLASDPGGTQFLHTDGLKNLTTVPNENSFIIFELTGEQTEYGFDLYAIKFQATGEYIEDQVITDMMDSSDMLNYHLPYFTTTTDLGAAAKWTILPAATRYKIAKDEEGWEENWRTYTGQGTGQDTEESTGNKKPYDGAFVIMRDKLTDGNGSDPVYLEVQSDYTMFAPWGNNDWYLFTYQGKTVDHLLYEWWDTNYPEGLDALQNAVGDKVGQYKEESVAVLLAAYEAYTNWLIDGEGDAEEIYAQSKAAYEALEVNEMADGYYYLVAKRSNSGVMDDNGVMRGVENFEIPRKNDASIDVTLESSRYLWYFTKKSEKGTYIIKNFGTGKYVKTAAHNDNTGIKTDDAADAVDYTVVYSEEYPGTVIFKHFNDKGERDCSWNYFYSNGKVIGNWYPEDDGNSFFLYNVDEVLVDAIADEVRQYDINSRLQELYDNAVSSYQRGIAYEPAVECTRDDNFSNHGYLSTSNLTIKDANGVSAIHTDESSGTVLGLLDGDKNTYTHTKWSDTTFPHYFEIDLGEGNELDAIALKLMRRTGSSEHDASFGIGEAIVYARNSVEEEWVRVANLAMTYDINLYVRDENGQITVDEEGNPVLHSWYGKNSENYVGIGAAGLGAKYRYLRLQHYKTIAGAQNTYFCASEIALFGATYAPEKSLNKIVPTEILTTFEDELAKAKEQLKVGKGTEDQITALQVAYDNYLATIAEHVELVEGTPYTNNATLVAKEVSYTRTLPNQKWNALYLPVEIPVSELSENYDLAYFNDMHAYDRNSDGVVDEMDMEIFLIKEGTLHANHPYFIRAKSEAAKKLQLVLNNVVLHPAEETSLTCSSVYTDFTLTGVYTRHMAEDLPGCYAITGSGAWAPIAAGSYLNPFRCYLKMTARDGSPVKVDEALKSIRIRAHGEDDTTDIDNMTINGQQPAVIYDLQGRRVSNPGKGLYIVNGKKVMLK